MNEETAGVVQKYQKSTIVGAIKPVSLSKMMLSEADFCFFQML